MKTKSYAKIGLLDVQIGYGKSRPLDVPKTLFLDVINFKYKDESELATFCSENKIYPSKYPSKSLAVSFEEERNQLMKVAKDLFDKKYSREVVNEINKHLGTIQKQVQVVSEKNLHTINSNKKPLEERSTKYLITKKKYNNAFTPLWELMVDHFIEKQDVKMCANCGNFYLLDSKRKSRKWCSDTCKNNYSHRKRYHEKKSSK